MSKRKCMEAAGVVLFFGLIMAGSIYGGAKENGKETNQQISIESGQETSEASTDYNDDLYDEDGLYIDERLQQYLDGFTIKKVTDSDEKYYECSTKVGSEDLTVKVNKEETKAVLSYKGKECEIDIPFLFSWTFACADMSITDLTGDGEPEFIFEYSYGTGSWENRCTVVDLETMKPYEVVTDVSSLIEKLQIEPVEIVDTDYVLTRIIDDKGQTYLAKVVKWNDESLTKPEDFSFDISTIQTSINRDGNQLYANVSITLDKAAPWNFLGEIDCPYVFDEEEKAFRPDGTMSEFEVYTSPVVEQQFPSNRKSTDEVWKLYLSNTLDESITIEEISFAKEVIEDRSWKTMENSNGEQKFLSITMAPGENCKIELDVSGYDRKPDTSYRLTLKVKTGEKYENTSFVTYCYYYLNE